MAIKLVAAVVAALLIIAIYALAPASKLRAPEPLAQSGLNADKSPYLAASASASSNRTSEPTYGAQSSGAKMPGQAVVDVSTPSGRQAYYDRLLTLTPKQIFEEWTIVSSRENPDELAQLVAALGQSLRRSPDTVVYGEIGAKLINKSGRLADRLAAADILMSAATPEAVDQLMKFLRASEAWSSSVGIDGLQDSVVVAQVLSSITTASRTLVDGGRNWAVANSLQTAWQSVGADASPQVIDAIASAIAYVGKPEGIAYLVQSASRLDQADKRFVAAMSAIEGVSSNDSSEALGFALQQFSYSAAIYKPIVRGLISIGSADSIVQVTKYLDRSVGIDKSWMNEVDSLLARRQLSPEAEKVWLSWKGRR